MADRPTETRESPVLVVGAGPVGMTLALDLASRGVDVTVVDKRGEHDAPKSRCNHISARTLEVFRRLGVAAEIRRAGLPGNYPQDVVYTTSMTGYELARIRIPARNDRFGSLGYADSGWPTPEPPHRCNQMYFEPILQRHMQNTPGVRVLWQTELETVDQDDAGATAVARSLGDGERLMLKARYLVGCDGASSLVRKAIGASFEGVPVISRTRTFLIRSPDLSTKIRMDRAWMTWVLSTDGIGNVIALNGRDLWAFHFILPASVEDFDSIQAESALRRAVGADISYEVLSVDDWFGRRLVASHFHDRRLVVCGDAAHIWIPFAGYGMNAGIADAEDLAWQLAAIIHGWGDAALLDAYEAERHPITDQVSRQVMEIALKNLNNASMRTPSPELLEDGPSGDAMRAKLGQVLHDANVGQFACIGLNFGTYYDRSPIITYDGEPAPAYDLLTYTPSTVPGCRTPHFWFADGSSLYDRLGADFTLLRFDQAIDVTALQTAAAAAGVPMQLLDVSADEEVGTGHRHKLVLSRPDRHVAWRGQAVPSDPQVLIDRIRGASVPLG